MRDLFPILVIILILGLLGGFSWLTNNPDSPWLEKAQEWPVVGELAKKMREAYLGPDDASSDGAESVASNGSPAARGAGTSRRAPSRTGPNPVNSPESLPIPEGADGLTGGFTPMRPAPSSEAPAPTPPPQAAEPRAVKQWNWFLPGQPVLEKPTAGAKVLTRLKSLAYLPVFTLDGTWREAHFDGRDGWLDSTWQPSFSREDGRRGWRRERADSRWVINKESLRSAFEILGSDAPQKEVGDYRLYTDVDDILLLAWLEGAAEVAEQAFFARYGRVPSKAPEHAILLFARTEDYQRFTRENSRVPLSGHAGHAGAGYVALTAERHGSEAVVQTLIHEIGHILTRRALSARLPPWLLEGLASDLGYFWTEQDLYSPRRRRGGGSIAVFGGFQARALRLQKLMKQGELPHLVQVLRLNRESFYSEQSSVNYGVSTFFIRYLLDGEDGALAPGFLEFLDLIAEGKPSDLAALVGRSGEELNDGLRRFIEAEAAIVEQRKLGLLGPRGGIVIQ